MSLKTVLEGECQRMTFDDHLVFSNIFIISFRILCMFDHIHHFSISTFQIYPNQLSHPLLCPFSSLWSTCMHKYSQMFTFILEHCGFNLKGKLIIPPQNLTNTNSSIPKCETLINSPFLADIWSSFSIHQSCAYSHNYCYYSCKLPCSLLKTLLPFSHLPPLYLLFLCPLFHNDP